MTLLEVSTADQAPLPSKIPDGDEGKIARSFVEAFAVKAQQVGIRSIVMSDVAKSLRVSKKTLYKYFPGKESLVYELVVRWENRLYTPVVYEDDDIIESLRHWVDTWVQNDGQYSTAFWRDLRDDYPHLYKIYAVSLTARTNIMRELLKPYLRDGLNIEFVFSAYYSLLTQAARRKMFERLGMTRKECVHQALNLWIKAVFDEEKIKRRVQQPPIVPSEE